MSVDFIKQAETPLYPELLWERPTMRSRAGRVLIVGGQRNQFSAMQALYQLAEAAGIGEVQAAMPDSLRRLVGEAGFARFVPASASGSLGRAALGELLQMAADFDGLILGANLTNNAETAVMIESLVREIEQPLVITEDAIEILKFEPTLITGNPRALVITTMQGLFSLANHHHLPLAIKPHAGVMGKLEILQQLVDIGRCSYVVFDQEVMVAAEGKLSLTLLPQALSALPAAVIGVATTFWLQHRAKPFAALTMAAFLLAEISGADRPTYTSLAASLPPTLRRHER